MDQDLAGSWVMNGWMIAFAFFFFFFRFSGLNVLLEWFLSFVLMDLNVR